MTDVFLERYSDFENAGDYFDAYKVETRDLADCPVPLSVISAKDDGMIPYQSIEALELNTEAQKILLDYGGHNGFFQSLTGSTWYEDYILKEILG